MPLPILSCPLKQATDIDWIEPLKRYIAHHYSDDPSKFSEECATLNNLRQDVRGTDNDTAAARDLMFRYYGQLEMLDLRFPIDETHIKILFNWYDAFTHKAVSQYSLAYEKASVIFNIAAILSHHAIEQPRHDPAGVKTAYHDLQTSAGMFTYINDNFLHAPSTDLGRECVKTLTAIMLAQAQEVFADKAISEGKNEGLLAKLTSQAAYFYNQALEGLQEHSNEAGFDRLWLQLVQFKKQHFSALANFYQSTADENAKKYGVALGRLALAQRQAKEALKQANSFPSSLPLELKLPSDSAALMTTAAKGLQQKCTDRLTQLNKDNDFVYHDKVSTEAELEDVGKMAAAKAIPIAEIYQTPEVQRAIGPDIFHNIVPMSVTESASLYDEEKAKLVRAETERVEQANDELAASLDYMKLPGGLSIIKGGLDKDTRVNREFYGWCQDVSEHKTLGQELERFGSDQSSLLQTLDTGARNLDMEESVCEKMRNKYGGQWVQVPSSSLTSTLRNDIKSYKEIISQAAKSDQQLLTSYQQAEADMEEMRAAADSGSIDAFYNKAMSGATTSAGSGGANLLDDVDDNQEQSVAAGIEAVEDLLKRLELVKRERQQVLKDLKEKIRADDISNILILNSKKATSSQDNQIFKAELDKFRPYQSRILQATHKQHSLVKQLTQTYGELLDDKRVKSEQDRYEAFIRRKTTVLSKYRKVHRTYKDLQTGLDRARSFYSQIKDTVNSLNENIETFLGNRKSEGSQLLKTIESSRALEAESQSKNDGSRLAGVMARMNVGQPSPVASVSPPAQMPYSYTPTAAAASPFAQPGQHMVNPGQYQYGQSQPQSNVQSPYGGYAYPPAPGAFNRPSPQQYISPQNAGMASPPPLATQQQQQMHQQPAPYTQPSMYGQTMPQQQQQQPPGSTPSQGQAQAQPDSQSADPWAGLSSWK